MASPRVLVLGDIMRDVIVRPDGPVRPGDDRRAAIATTWGGSGANQAAWLASFGVPVRFVGCVGRDDRDQQADRMRRQGIEPVLAGHPDAPTGTVVAMVDSSGERSFLTDRGANDGLTRASLPPDLLAGVALFHLSGYALVGPATRETALQLLVEARQACIPVSFDPGSAAFIEEVGAARILSWTRDAALCCPNAAEATALAGTDHVETQWDCLMGHYGLTIIKSGAAGAQARSREGNAWKAAAPAVSAVDTTGAGDAFMAAFLAAWLTGRPVPDCLERAVAAGARAAAAIGGQPRPGDATLSRWSPAVRCVSSRPGGPCDS